MEQKYDPADFEYPMNKFMSDAYKTYLAKNKVLLNAAVANIDVEVKISIKSGIMTHNEGAEIKEYFWELFDKI